MFNPTKTAIAFILCFFIPYIQSCETQAVIATQTIQQADEFNNQKRYNEAIVYYEKYIQIAPSLGVYRNLSMEADVYRKLAHAYSTGLKYDSSLYCLQKAVKIDSVSEPNALDIIEDYRQTGLTYGYKGDYINSIRFLKQSLELNTGMDKSFKDVKRYSIGDTYLSLAQVNFVIGNYHEAEEEVAKAILIYKRIENEYLGLLESYLLLGKIRIEQGDIKDGLNLIENSIQIAENNNINTARHYQAIGSAYLSESKYEEALKSRVEALKKAEESKIIPQITWMNVKVGDVFSYIGDDNKAASYYESALSSASGTKEEILAVTP
jgi:tetratricopeptide (TPR) repeat protein